MLHILICFTIIFICVCFLLTPSLALSVLSTCCYCHCYRCVCICETPWQMWLCAVQVMTICRESRKEERMLNYKKETTYFLRCNVQLKKKELCIACNIFPIMRAKLSLTIVTCSCTNEANKQKHMVAITQKSCIISTFVRYKFYYFPEHALETLVIMLIQSTGGF